jgi:hypothetical protein
MFTLTPGFCYRTRQELLDQLAKTVETLEELMLQLGTLSAGDIAWEYELELEVEGLRNECAGIRAALGYHHRGAGRPSQSKN